MKSGKNKILVKVNDRLVREIEMGARKLILDPTYDIYKNTKTGQMLRLKNSKIILRVYKVIYKVYNQRTKI